jgi:hypothetical protein
MLIYCILLNTVIATLLFTVFLLHFPTEKQNGGPHVTLNSLKILKTYLKVTQISKNMYSVIDLYYNRVKYQYEKKLYSRVQKIGDVSMVNSPHFFKTLKFVSFCHFVLL